MTLVIAKVVVEVFICVFGILYLVRMQIFKNNSNNKISSPDTQTNVFIGQ